MAQTVLVVDDAENLRVLLKSYLTQEGYRVVTANNGREALFTVRQEKPDIIILDLMMPEMGGYDFMRHYSREGNAPIILLTAKIEESDKVLGLELGADDYVTKPFSMRELAARIRAVLRRAGKAAPQAEILRAGEITLDRGGRLVQVANQTVNLTPSEFDLLAALMAEPGRAFSRADLLDLLQGTTFEGYERTIDVHVRNLRTKIEPDPSQPRYIETVYGHGYRLSPDAQ
ncbi:MAG: response regulator transcription factor [Chloroflexi bacterium]|nr:response regulator transcription factor [Chloroflexota bacterium]MBP8057567.1 response regulator transcription factor [Chloroflexota bacterium]